MQRNLTLFIEVIFSLDGLGLLGYEAVLSRDLDKNDEREEYMRTKLSYSRNNEIIARPYLRQDSSMSYYLAKADGLIIRKPYDRALKAGKKVLVIPFSKISHTL